MAYEDQVDDKLRGRRAAARQIDGDEYRRDQPGVRRPQPGPRVAVIYAAGTITGGKSGYDPVNGPVAGSDTLIEYIRQARRDSVGARHRAAHRQPRRIGDGVGRDLARADDRKERARRPAARRVDVGSGGVGGYYIAMPAQVIVAQPSTLTGSIGIFGGKFVTGGVYEKLGAQIESTSIGRNAEINSPARPYNPEELKKLQEQLQSFYDQFVEKVADSRHSTPEKIDALAQGRVWTGRQAKQNKLVDELGGLDRADRDREAARENRRRQRRGNRRLSAAKELLRAAVGTVQRVGRVAAGGRGHRLAEREPVERGDRSAARIRGPFAMFRRGELLALMPFTFVR